MPDRELALARRWMSKARTDLALARVILEKGLDMEPWACCFHAQQAAEKAMKAVLDQPRHRASLHARSWGDRQHDVH